MVFGRFLKDGCSKSNSDKYKLQDNASYIEMATNSFERLQLEETWTNFGLYLINNTMLVTPMELFIDLNNKSLYDSSGDMV